MCRHRNVLKSTEKVKALSRLAGENPRGCNVGIYLKVDEAVAKAAALFVDLMSQFVISRSEVRW